MQLCSNQCTKQRLPYSACRIVLLLLSASLYIPSQAHALRVCTIYTLHQDETHETVAIEASGILDTNGHTLTVTGTDGLTCQSAFGVGGDLRIRGNNGKVILSGGGTHSIGLGAAIKLESPTAVLQIASTLTIAGRGRIIGKDSKAVISIASAKTLTNRLDDIRGALVIQGPGTLRNEGKVTATAACVAGASITLADDLSLQDIPTAKWHALDGGVLNFNHAQTGNATLRGDIIISGLGTLTLNASITTIGAPTLCDGGMFVWDEGALDLAPNVTFTYSCFGGVCDNPGSGTPFSLPGQFYDLCL